MSSQGQSWVTYREAGALCRTRGTRRYTGPLATSSPAIMTPSAAVPNLGS